MRWVEAATGAPHRCAAIPFVGMNHELGYIQTGAVMDGFDNEVYISVVAVKEMATIIGYPTVEEHRNLVVEANRIARQLEATTAELAAARAELDAIDMLASAGFVARKKPGRPKREAVQA